MANFPTSAPSFSNKSNGQTIDASHINSLQDEVVAIGGGYVNGTAPILSSNTTMGGGWKLTGVLTPATLSSGNTADYNPSGLSAASVLRVSGPAGGSTVVGMVAVANLKLHVINVGLNPITFKQDTGTVGNRFAFNAGGDLAIGTNQSFTIWYDAVTAYWRQLI